MKKRLVSLVCALAMVLAMFPVSAFAEEAAPVMKVKYEVKLEDNTTPEFLSGGESVAVTVYAEAPAGCFYGGVVRMYYDTDLLEPQRAGRDYRGDVGEAFDNEELIVDWDSYPSDKLLAVFLYNTMEAPPAVQGSGYQELFTFYLTVKKPLPVDITRGLEFSFTLNNFYFGTRTAATIDNTDGINNPYAEKAVDTEGPTVLVKGSEITEDSVTYKYQPITVTAEDENGPCTLTTDEGVAAAADGTLTLTEGKTYHVHATDKNGNTTDKTVVLDVADFNNAQQALNALKKDTYTYAIGEEIEKAKGLIGKLDEATQKELLNQENLTTAENAFNTILVEKGKVETAIKELLELVQNGDKGAILKKVSQVDSDVWTLTETYGVPTDQIVNYAEYKPISDQAQGDLVEITNIKASITALGITNADGVTFDNKGTIKTYYDKVMELEGRYGAGICANEGELIKTLWEAAQDLETNWNATLQEVKDAGYTKDTVKLRDKEALTELWDKVNTFISKGIKWTDDPALKALDEAHGQLDVLKAQRDQLHDLVMALKPEEADYSIKDDYTRYEALLAELDDDFTPEEQQVIEACKAAVKAIEAQMAAFGDKMLALDAANVHYSDIANRDGLQNTLDNSATELKCTKAQLMEYLNTNKAGAYTNYEAYCKAVEKMHEDIRALNEKMKKALKEDWKYRGDNESCAEIQKQMLQYQTDYEIGAADFEKEFPLFGRPEQMKAEAEQLLKDVSAAVKELPETVTLKEEDDVQNIIDKVEKLKSDYNMTDDELAEELAEDDVFKKYTAAKSTIEQLRKARDEASNKPGKEESKHKEETKPVEQEEEELETTSAPAPAPAAVTTIPRTADDSNPAFVWVTFLASALMLAACCVKLHKRKE